MVVESDGTVHIVSKYTPFVAPVSNMQPTKAVHGSTMRSQVFLAGVSALMMHLPWILKEICIISSEMGQCTILVHCSI